MNTTESTNELVLSALLSKLAGVLDGLVDTGTANCASPVPEAAKRFLDGRLTVLSSIAVLVPEFIGAAAYQVPLRDLVSGVRVGCSDLHKVFAVLQRFRAVELSDLESATKSLSSIYESMQSHIRGIAKALGVAIPYLDSRSSDRSIWYRSVLDKLFQILCAER